MVAVSLLVLAGGLWALWPRERPAGAPAPEANAAAPATQKIRAPNTAESLRVGARWGSGKGELGHKRQQEGAAEGPMSLVAGKDGDTWVLDQVNGRIVHFDPAGRAASEIKVAETAQDLAIGPHGNLYVLDRLGKAEVAVFDAAGTPIVTDAVVGGPITEGGAVTGIFVGENGVFLEREHADNVRIAAADGRFDSDRPVVPGRPTRDGKGYVRVAVKDHRSQLAVVTAYGLDGAERWKHTVAFPRSILHIITLDTDLAGHAYVVADVAEEAASPQHELRNVATVVARLALADGADRGAITMQAPSVPDEVFRPITVTDDGQVVQMLPSNEGVRIATYRFP
jgi:hypothetical protein